MPDQIIEVVRLTPDAHRRHFVTIAIHYIALCCETNVPYSCTLFRLMEAQLAAPTNNLVVIHRVGRSVGN